MGVIIIIMSFEKQYYVKFKLSHVFFLQFYTFLSSQTSQVKQTNHIYLFINKSLLNQNQVKN